MSTKLSKIIKFILRYFSFSLIVYYFIFLALDILLQGIVDRFIKISFLVGLFLVLTFILSNFFPKNKEKIEQGRDPSLEKRIFPSLLLLFFLVLFSALFPHDLLAAGILALTTLLLILKNKNYIIN